MTGVAAREGRMSIVGCLFRIWAGLTVLAVAIAAASYWLVDHLPAAQSAESANIYVNAFLITAPAPVLTVPALVAVGLVWGLLRWLSRRLHRSEILHHRIL
jgi:hypothetical protein